MDALVELLQGGSNVQSPNGTCLFYDIWDAVERDNYIVYDASTGENLYVGKDLGAALETYAQAESQWV